MSPLDQLLRMTLVPLRLGVRALGVGMRAGLRRAVPFPDVDVPPEPRLVELPGRGSTMVLDLPGPSPDAPTLLLLHGMFTTGRLNWFTALDELSRRYRVVAFDLRWHGRGVSSPRFRVADCADDAAAVLEALGVERAVVVGYSLGGAVAQETWRRHPSRVAGLVLCSTSACWKQEPLERLFFPVLGAAMASMSGFACARVERLAARLPDLPAAVDDVHAWGLAEVRTVSPWSMPEVLSELGRFDARPWLGDVDVPVAVVVTERDGAIKAERQHALADLAGAETFTAPGGHTSVVLDCEHWVPVLADAVDAVVAALPGRVAEAG